MKILNLYSVHLIGSTMAQLLRTKRVLEKVKPSDSINVFLSIFQGFFLFKVEKLFNRLFTDQGGSYLYYGEIFYFIFHFAFPTSHSLK